jgi:hypothetical protein
VSLKELLEILQRKRVELDYLRLRLKDGGDNVAGFVTTISFQDNPSPMIAVLTSPICVGYEVGSGPEEGLHRTSACRHGPVMRNLNQESCHYTSLLKV